MRKQLLDEFNIEIGAGLGPLAGKIWRVGLMGASSSPRLIVLLRGALESALAQAGPPRSHAVSRSRRREPDVGRRLARDPGASPAVGFARARLRATSRCPTSVRSTTIESRRPPRSSSCATREARAQGKTPRRVQRWVELRPHLAEPEARGARRRRRCVLAARRRGLRAAAGVDGDRLGARTSSRAARSTITQQLAKNLYLSPSKNPLRKLRELIIARRLEAELTKARILELYLNVIEWGDGIYGAEAAARTYFRTVGGRRSARPKSALLAGAIVNPRVLNPGASDARGCCGGSR